jgi:hypothetical protein
VRAGAYGPVCTSPSATTITVLNTGVAARLEAVKN